MRAKRAVKEVTERADRCPNAVKTGSRYIMESDINKALRVVLGFHFRFWVKMLDRGSPTAHLF